MGKSLLWELPPIQEIPPRASKISRTRLVAIVNMAIDHAVISYPDEVGILRPEKIREAVKTAPRILSGEFLLRTRDFECGCPLTTAGNIKFVESDWNEKSTSNIESEFYSTYDSLMPKDYELFIVTDD